MPFIQYRLVVLSDCRLWFGTESFDEEFPFIKIQQVEIKQIGPATGCRTVHCSGFNANKVNVLFGGKEELSASTMPFLALISRNLNIKSWQPEDTLWTKVLKSMTSEVWSVITFIYFLYTPLNTSKANNKTAKQQVHPLTSGSTGFMWGGLFCTQPTLKARPWKPLSARPDLQFYHSRLCIYFWFEVKGSGGAEKWRGLLKVRAAFPRCSGGHPSSYFTQVGAHRSQSRCTPSTGKKKERQAARWRQRETKHRFKGMRRE